MNRKINDILLREARTCLDDTDADALVAHSHSVREEVRRAGGGDLEQEVALLHDVVEDCCPADMEPEAYAATLPVSDEIRGAVLELTRRKGEIYADYIERVASGTRVAHFVKQCDLRVNLRKSEATGCDSLVKRYTRALDRLAT
ncbi:MAG: hypothetical protein OXF24_06820 [Hyphomicrobiales bacterium]|nr:hypothetical protein [Hyphomicrobiales bacterium]